MPVFASRLALIGIALLVAGSAVAEAPSAFLDAGSISWKVNEQSTSRWKTLVGGSEGGQLNDADIQFGIWQLAPKSTYQGHRHDSPEIYYILEGHAIWTVGNETREVTPGMTILTQPGQVHRMENRTNELVKAIWVWWAPGGDTTVFNGSYEFTEPPVPGAEGFSPAETEKIY